MPQHSAGSAGPPTALIATLQMDRDAGERFTALREAHFPPDRNWLQAHITLFHALPTASADTVLRDASEVAADHEAFTLRVDHVRSLGAGVAYALVSPRADALRRTLAARWEALLGRQDRHWHGRLHITVQNKVAPATARRLQERLAQDFLPHDIGAVGLQVWEYLGGPWRLLATAPFAVASVERTALGPDGADPGR